MNTKPSKTPFFVRHKGLPPAALWLAEDGRHYSGSPMDEAGYRPDMARLREYFKPGRQLYVCAWGAWAHGLPAIVADDPIVEYRRPQPGGWERYGVDIRVTVGRDQKPNLCAFQHLTPFKAK